ncbi:MAG: hypothetical protein ACOCXH_12360, partial [Cyclobacteriaceae bacterium]
MKLFINTLTLAGLLIVNLAAMAQPWQGTYSTPLGTLRLVQEGNEVYGEFENGTGDLVDAKREGTFDGYIINNKYVGTFYMYNPNFINEAQYKRIGTFELQIFGNIFGKYKYSDENNDRDFQGTRTSSARPTLSYYNNIINRKSSAWRGTWNSTFGQLRLHQEGSRVFGDYENGKAYIQGTYDVKTDKLTGVFVNDNIPNKGIIEFTRSGTTNFTGLWVYGTETPNSNWSGNRTNDDLPELKYHYKALAARKYEYSNAFSRIGKIGSTSQGAGTKSFLLPSNLVIDSLTIPVRINETRQGNNPHILKAEVRNASGKIIHSFSQEIRNTSELQWVQLDFTNRLVYNDGVSGAYFFTWYIENEDQVNNTYRSYYQNDVNQSIFLISGVRGSSSNNEGLANWSNWTINDEHVFVHRLYGLRAGNANTTINFTNIPDQTFGNQPVTLQASNSNLLPVGFQVVSGPAYVEDGRLIFTGAGTVMVEAFVRGTNNFKPVKVAQEVKVFKRKQNITFQPIPDKLVTDATFRLQATSTAGLFVSFTVTEGNDLVDLDGEEVFLNGNAGKVTIVAYNSGGANYDSAGTRRSFMINKLDQTIDFKEVSDRKYTNQPIKLEATASSELPVSFAVQSGPATISGDNLTITNAGSIVVKATQAGNSTYKPAEASQSFVVSKADQVLTFKEIPNKRISDPPFNIDASVDTKLPIVFSITKGNNVVKISGSQVTLTGIPGEVTIRARQNGDSKYNAVEVSRSFTVNDKESQTITFKNIPDQVYSTTPIALEASASSGLPVTFSLVSGPATLNGSQLTLTAAGNVTVK